MRKSILSILIISVTVANSQVLNLKPTAISALNFDSSIEEKFNSEESLEACSKIWKQMNEEDRRYPTSEEKEILKYCNEVKSSLWDTIGDGCSWYCGMAPKSIKSSSFLESQGSNTYDPKNAHDFSFKTAWVEGVSGYGIGEYLKYYFDPQNPRIHTIIIANGYVKTAKAWNENSRVKLLNVYHNDVLIAKLNLYDARAEQYFKVPLLGNDPDLPFDKIKEQNDWTLKFEIAEVYPGSKYDDTVISEIYFDGTDVHCLAKGTMILMADGSEKEIENLNIGDQVKSYDSDKREYRISEILELASTVHFDLIQVLLDDGSTISCTRDHPLLARNEWVSYDPVKTSNDYQFNTVGKIEIGTELQTLKGFSKVSEIKILPGSSPTYTIVKLSSGNSFVANGLIVGTEPLRLQGL